MHVAFKSFTVQKLHMTESLSGWRIPHQYAVKLPEKTIFVEALNTKLYHQPILKFL